MIELTIINRSGRAVPSAFLKAWVQRLAAELVRAKIPTRRLRGRELVIAFVTTREIQRLNKTYRGKNKTTDVLSFEGDDDTSLGELAIAPEVISRQAREHGLRVREELGYMVLHGVLHLLGYDHETSERDAKAMLTLQDGVFDKLLNA